MSREQYGLDVYDGMIVATALITGCETLYSEDMQDGLLIDHQLRICNPFAWFRGENGSGLLPVAVAAGGCHAK